MQRYIYYWKYHQTLGGENVTARHWGLLLSLELIPDKILSCAIVTAEYQSATAWFQRGCRVSNTSRFYEKPRPCHCCRFPIPDQINVFFLRLLLLCSNSWGCVRACVIHASNRAKGCGGFFIKIIRRSEKSSRYERVLYKMAVSLSWRAKCHPYCLSSFPCHSIFESIKNSGPIWCLLCEEYQRRS